MKKGSSNTMNVVPMILGPDGMKALLGQQLPHATGCDYYPMIAAAIRSNDREQHPFLRWRAGPNPYCEPTTASPQRARKVAGEYLPKKIVAYVNYFTLH